MTHRSKRMPRSSAILTGWSTAVRPPFPMPWSAVRARRPVLYATNNAARTRDVVAAHLRELGLAVEASDVVNSSQAAAWLLARHQPAWSRGARRGWPLSGLRCWRPGFQVVERIGAETRRRRRQGYGPTVTASDLAEAAYGNRRIPVGRDNPRFHASQWTGRGTRRGSSWWMRSSTPWAATRPGGGGSRDADLRIQCVDRLALPPQQVLAIGDRLRPTSPVPTACGMDSLVVLTGWTTCPPSSGAPTAPAPHPRGARPLLSHAARGRGGVREADRRGQEAMGGGRPCVRIRGHTCAA